MPRKRKDGDQGRSKGSAREEPLPLAKGDAPARLLQVSSSLRYQWRMGADGVAQLGDVSVGGQPLEAARNYRLVVNNFMAEGGDGQGVLRQATERVSIGVDLDAMVEWLSENPHAGGQIASGRIRRE